jgi:hypothetical protein
MKIIGISRQKSTPDTVALVTEQPVPPEVAESFKALYSERPQAEGIPLEVQGSVLLVHRPRLPADFVQFLEQCLTEAERIGTRWEDVLQERIQAEMAERDEALKHLSRELNLPLV